MTWLAWRQLRIPAVSVYAALVAIGVVLAITGPQLVDQTDFSDQGFLYIGTVLVLFALPVVLGVFWGVPMVARELETGTHGLVWNQTVTRTRWLATKLGIGALAGMVAAGLLSLAVSWWASPIDTLASTGAADAYESRVTPVVFAVRGIAPIGYAAFAFVLGIAAGIVLRRTVTAMAVTLVVYAAVQVAVPLVVRPYLSPPTEESVPITAETILGVHAERVDGRDVAEQVVVERPSGAWILTNETVDENGDVANPLPEAVQNCLPTPRPDAPPRFDDIDTCFAQLNDLGYHQRLVYQPVSRFWPLQLAETGLYLALSGLLTWFCFRRLRHLS